jgi:hypothetical protein
MQLQRTQEWADFKEQRAYIKFYFKIGAKTTENCKYREQQV